MDYTTLVAGKTTVGSIQYWINHSEVPSDDVLKDAQAEIYARLRVREMRASSTLALVVGTSSLALPAGFLDPIAMKDQYRCDVYLRSADELDGMRVLDSLGVLASGPIENYAIFDEALQFDMKSDVVANFSFLFFKQPDLLGSSNLTNFLTTRYPQLLRAAILKHAYAFRKSWEESKQYEAQLEKHFQTIEINDDLAGRGLNDPERYS
jgi:hypothetical protein